METNLDAYRVKSDTPVRDVVGKINENRHGIALVVDDIGKLVGTVTDGDVRRFLLSEGSLDQPCSVFMSDSPVTAHIRTDKAEIADLLRKFRLRNIPLVDDDGCLCGLVDFRELQGDEVKRAPVTVVIMAGGLGKRLRPITEDLPKPMIKVGDQPILEKIIKKFAAEDITDIYISVNYKAELIEDHFDDGGKFGVSIKYLRETRPLGTAGALALLPDGIDGPILLTNGDVVTTVSYSHILDFHRQHRASLSVAASEYRLKIPYGVLDLAGHFVMGLEEKPSRVVHCNAGIYVLDPELIHFVSRDESFDMPQLIEAVIKKGLPVAAFPITEYWVDIGENSALKKVQRDMSRENGDAGGENL